MKVLSSAFIVVLALFSPRLASAETWAYTDPAASGNQNWTGNLGMDFTVNQSIAVDALGIFNASGSGTITNPIKVAIYNNDGSFTQAVSAITFSGSYALGPGTYDVSQSIPEVILAPGNYSIVAVGFGPSDPNGNTSGGPGVSTEDTGGGLITFTGTARYDANTSIDFPDILDGGPANRYNAGTFEFQAAPVVGPEPGTLVLFGLGSTLLLTLRRRIQK